MIPPPGPKLAFKPWCRLVHREVRASLPDVRVEAPDERTVIWRHGADEVSVTDDGGTWACVERRPGSTAGLRTQDHDRHDPHTAHVCARNILGCFEVRFAIEGNEAR